MWGLAAITSYMPDSCQAAICFIVALMGDNTHLMTWVPRDTKDRFTILARNRELSESALLKQLVELALAGAGIDVDKPPLILEPVSAKDRLSIRLEVSDVLLLRERARARGIPSSRYVSLLLRSHLRNVAPLPPGELDALRRCIAEVGAIGRNLNQIARAMNQGEPGSGPTRSEIRVLLAALTELKVRIKAVLAANLASRRDGHEKTPG